MPRDIRPAPQGAAILVGNALGDMRRARYWLKSADCPKALAALDRAIKSAEGAKRHAGHRERRTSSELELAGGTHA